MLDDIFQFAHVAGEIVFHQTRQDLVGDAHHVLALQPVEFGDKVIGQQRDVFAALAEARQLESHHVNPVEQVLAERARLDQSGQILMRGRQHAHIRSDRFDRSQWLEHFFLQDAQQSRLHRWRNITDLVQKDRTAAGQGEPSGLVAASVGKRTGFVTKQFRFQERVGQSTAVDGDEGMVFAARQ